jgi:hypothetical protein
MPVVLSGTNGVTFPDSSLQTAAASPYVLKNRIINGAMVVDQRNAGAAVTVNTNGAFYATDRFRLSGITSSGVFTGQQIADAPTGFNNSLRVTVTTADASLGADDIYYCVQPIEGFNVADLGFGSAAAQTVTLSFWTKSTLSGTFGGSLSNSAVDRSYPFTYTISAANTWEYKTITIAGDTSGTWLTTNGVGMRVYFGLGVGSNFTGTANQWNGAFDISAASAVNVMGTLSATWQITGVQLEIGTTATPFERRLYNQELANCQRYYYRVLANGVGYVFGQSFNAATTLARGVVNFPTTMRTEITALEQSGTASNYQVAHGNLTLTSCSSVPTFSTGQKESCAVNFTVSSGLTAGNGSLIRAADSSAYLGFSAEL